MGLLHVVSELPDSTLEPMCSLCFHPTLYESNVWNSCPKMVHLKMNIRNSVIRNERYLKEKKEMEAIVQTIEGTDYNIAIWLSDTKTISHAHSQVNQEKKRM